MVAETMSGGSRSGERLTSAASEARAASVSEASARWTSRPARTSPRSEKVVLSTQAPIGSASHQGSRSEDEGEGEAGGERRSGRHQDDEDAVGELGAGPAARPAPLQRADQPAHPDDGCSAFGGSPSVTSMRPASSTVASASRQS